MSHRPLAPFSASDARATLAPENTARAAPAVALVELIEGIGIAATAMSGMVAETNTIKTATRSKQNRMNIDWALSDKIAATAIVVGTLQFFALVATVFVMIRTSRRQLRAYIFNDHANLVDFDEVPIAQVLLKNAGQTPAYNVVAWNAVQLAPFPLSTNLLGAQDAEVTRCNLGPGMDFHLTTRLSRLPEAIKFAIREGRQALYVFGRADYVDAFGQARFLEWRLFYGADSIGRVDGSLGVCPEGSDAN